MYGNQSLLRLVSSANYLSHIKALSLFSTLLKLHFIAFCKGNYINLSTNDFFVQIILCWWGVRSLPCALQNVKTASLASQRHAKPQVAAAKNVSGHRSMSSGGETAPVRSQWSRTIPKKGDSQNSQEVALQDGNGLLALLFSTSQSSGFRHPLLSIIQS